MTARDRGPRHDRGATIPIVAIALPVLVLMTSFAVDLGRQRNVRRTMQATADVIALDMVRLADGRDSLTIYGDPATESALVASAERNGIDRAQVIEIVWGEYDPSMSPLPFQPHHQPQFAPVAGLIPDAVKITTSDSIDYFFQPGTGSATRTAVATNAQRTALTVGSVAAGVQTALPGVQASVDATVEALNSRLQASFGAGIPSPGNVGLDAASYNGLASTDVDLWRVAAAGGFASPNELLDADITAGELLSWTAAALDQQAAEGDPNAASSAASVRALGTAIDQSTGLDAVSTIRLGDTIEFAQGGDDAAATGSIRVLDLLSAGAEVVDGKNFLSYSFTPGIPGVALAEVRQYLVQPATTRYNLGVGGFATNKQSAFQVVLTLAPLPGTGLLPGMTGPAKLPLVIEAATATGTVDSIRCGQSPPDRQVVVDVDTNLLRADVGTASQFEAGDYASVQLGVIADAGDLTLGALLNLGVNVLLGNDLRAQASAALAGASDQMLTFTPDVPPNPFQRAQGGLGATSLGTQLSNTLQARYGSTIFSALSNVNLASELSYAFDDLDDLIIGPLLASNGLSIGGADVRAFDLDCRSLKLVG